MFRCIANVYYWTNKDRCKYRCNDLNDDMGTEALCLRP